MYYDKKNNKSTTVDSNGKSCVCRMEKGEEY